MSMGSTPSHCTRQAIATSPAAANRASAKNKSLPRGGNLVAAALTAASVGAAGSSDLAQHVDPLSRRRLRSGRGASRLGRDEPNVSGRAGYVDTGPGSSLGER